MFKGNAKWVFFLVCALIVSAAGLMVAKTREKDFLARIYTRKNFSLVDDRGNIFELAKQKDYLLLVFTPDGIPPATVRPMRAFQKSKAKFAERKIQLVMITRTNREIARNFRDSARFPGVLLTDPSGSVGKWLGIWKDLSPVDYWAFVLIDTKMNLLWGQAGAEIPSPETLLKEIAAAVPATLPASAPATVKK